jgi:hypothetical protein
MKRSGLLFVTVLAFLLTGFTLPYTGWLHARTTRHVEARSHAKNRDPLSSDTGWRWRQCQPAHWRACLLQR